MSAVIHHLVRRGVEVTEQHFSAKGDQTFAAEFSIPKWGVALLWTTALVYLATLAAVRYTYGSVVATLAMIESPAATVILKSSPEESQDPDSPLILDEKSSDRYVEQELLLVKAQPITAKFRTTIRHLRARAGWLSRFRGLHVKLIYHAIQFGLVEIYIRALDVRTPLLRGFVSVFITTCLCRIDALWTHVVISEPSSKSWFSRMPTRKYSKKLVLPALMWALAQQFSLHFPIAVYKLYQNANAVPSDKKNLFMTISMLFSFLAVALIIFPFTVSLKRVQASLLPEEDESIVPFDRTFGGKVVPEILGGSGKINMRDAWKTFDWNSRIRLMKVYAKVFAIQGAFTVLFAFVVVAELQMMLGDQLMQMATMVRENTASQRIGN